MAGPLKDGKGTLLVAGLGMGLIGREILARLREVDLRGQVVLVTGGSRGLGFLLAREFAREGCRLALCARDEQELERAKQELGRETAEVQTIRCDVGDRGEVEDLTQEVLQRYGQIDILVNNAGVIQVGPVQTMRLEDYEQALAVMFWGVVYPTLAVLPHMRERRTGRIVNITSIGGKVSVPHLVPYNCAKFAAVGFSEGLRAELAQEGITVVTIVPGLMRTGSHLNAYVKGNQEGEFTRFSLAATLPFVSMDAERAARQVVQATKRGESERILTIPANLMAVIHGMFPGATSDFLGLVNRFALPSANGASTATARGKEVQDRLRSPILEKLTAWGLSAARRFNQYDSAGDRAPGAAEAKTWTRS